MQPEGKREVVRRFAEGVMNGGNLDVADELISPDHVNLHPTDPGGQAGPEGIKRLISACRSAFPDIGFETGEMSCEGDVRRQPLDLHEGEILGAEEKEVRQRGDEPRRERGRITASCTVLALLAMCDETLLRQRECWMMASHFERGSAEKLTYGTLGVDDEAPYCGAARER